MMLRLTFAPLALLGSAWLAACGDGARIQPAQRAGDGAGPGKGSDAKVAAFDDAVKPPRGYYDALFAAALRQLDTHAAALTDTPADPVLWVNFDGAALTKGFQPGQSFLLCKDAAQLPAATDLSAADRDLILAQVRQAFTAAGTTLAVTATKPAAGDFTTIHVGGAFTDLGCVGANVLGVAPFDAGNANRNDVGFAFTQGAGGAKVIADTVAHEAGHTFGLEHVDNAADLMAAVAGPDAAGFAVSKVSGSTRVQDAPALLRQSLGPAAAAAPVNATPAPAPAAGAIPGLANLPAGFAGLPGLDQLAAIGKLLPGLQPGSVVDISKLLPEIQALLPAAASGVSLQGLDKILTVLGVASAANAQAGGGAGAVPAAPGVATALGAFNPQLLGALLSAKSGNPLLNLGKLVQLGGFANLQTAVSAVQGSVAAAGGKAAAGAPAQAAGLPNLASLLNLLGQVPDVATLLGSLAGSAAVVNGNFTAADAQALTSLLKVAYAQQLQQVLGNLP